MTKCNCAHRGSWILFRRITLLGRQRDLSRITQLSPKHYLDYQSTMTSHKQFNVGIIGYG